jgi:RNA polymerase sigma-70 factor (ECF subfamily)
MAATADADLVEQAASGNVEAFEALIAPRLHRSFRTANAILGSEADAHDVLQDAHLAAWRYLPRLGDRANFDGWLNTLIVNRCRDVLRRRRRDREVPIDHGAEIASGDPTAGLVDFASLNASFEQLPFEQRHILVAHHLHGVPVAELARELRIPVGTAKWRLHAARAALERGLEADR